MKRWLGIVLGLAFFLAYLTHPLLDALALELQSCVVCRMGSGVPGTAHRNQDVGSPHWVCLGVLGDACADFDFSPAIVVLARSPPLA